MADEYPPCPDHVERQHRDGLPPWCPRCGWTHGLRVPAQKLGESRAERDARRMNGPGRSDEVPT